MGSASWGHPTASQHIIQAAGICAFPDIAKCFKNGSLTPATDTIGKGKVIPEPRGSNLLFSSPGQLPAYKLQDHGCGVNASHGVPIYLPATASKILNKWRRNATAFVVIGVHYRCPRLKRLKKKNWKNNNEILKWWFAENVSKIPSWKRTTGASNVLSLRLMLIILQ